MEWLQPTAPVIGILPVFSVETAEVHLASVNRLAIYSSGVTGATGPQGGELDLSLQLLAARIAAYSPGEQFDDMTLVIARAPLC